MELTKRSPLHAPLQQLGAKAPLLWLNHEYTASAMPDEQGKARIADAARRLDRAASLLQQLFPELGAAQGRIHSPLVRIDALRAEMNKPSGHWFAKQDHLLPVAGSIKARGGFHEVLVAAESIAQGWPNPPGNLDAFASSEARAHFAAHAISVGSTGNLGLGIGMLASALGFETTVHMSADAKAWKKDRLRARGIRVVEHEGDYAEAVAAGRAAAARDPRVHFVDDENSVNLFMGYAVAAAELVEQLRAHGLTGSPGHPLFVYLPCGVGGAPGGITYGLKALLGPHVHCFFAEPVASPCMLVQLSASRSEPVSVYDIGLDNKTEADGLAVGLASPLVVSLVGNMISGVYTVTDDRLLRDTFRLAEREGIEVEPSAAAGLSGPAWLLESEAGRTYLAEHGLMEQLDQATHIVWTTGGSLVPRDELDRFIERGRALA